jgi:translation initiation factor 1
MKRQDPNARAVYSTDRRELAAIESRNRARDPGRPAPPAGGSPLRVRLETKGRGGKAVTVVTGFRGDPKPIEALSRELKARCGAGGAVKPAEGGFTVEVQGDQRDRVEALLTEKGLAFRRG